MKNCGSVAGKFYIGMMSVIYLVYFVLNGIGIDIYDYTYYDNDEWLMALGLIGLLLANLIGMIPGKKLKKEEEKQEEQETVVEDIKEA